MSRTVRIQQLAEYLGTSIHTLYNKVGRNEIPFQRLGYGRTLYFDLDEIDAHMREQGSGAAFELQSSQATQEQETRPKAASQRQGRGRKKPPGGSPAQRKEALRISSEIMAGE